MPDPWVLLAKAGQFGSVEIQSTYRGPRYVHWDTRVAVYDKEAPAGHVPGDVIGSGEAMGDTLDDSIANAIEAYEPTTG